MDRLEPVKPISISMATIATDITNKLFGTSKDAINRNTGLKINSRYGFKYNVHMLGPI